MLLGKYIFVPLLLWLGQQLYYAANAGYSQPIESIVHRPLLQEGQAQKAECREGDAAKNVCPVKEQQVDCVPHGHPGKEHRIRLDRSNCLHDRRDTERTDPA